MDESNPNILETFACARQDKEIIRSRIALFAVYYLVFMAVARFVQPSKILYR